MNSRLVSCSLALNLVLLGMAVYWAAARHSGDKIPVEPTLQTNPVTGKSFEVAPTAPAVDAASTVLRWNELESEDYPTYVANLRKAGCPEPVVRRIIGAEAKELYARKAFALAQEFHRDFWQIAARENVHEHFEKTLGGKVKALCKESDALLKQLVGEPSSELPGTSLATAQESGFTDFLPQAKQEQLRQLAAHYQARQQAIREANLSKAEKAFQLTELSREMEKEKAEIFSAEEWAEYQLRRSHAARELQQLYGVDFSETELRKLAQAINDYNHRPVSETVTDSETLDQILQAVLGPERFGDFNRARSASYREIYEIAADFDRPAQTAAEIFDLRLESEKESDQIRADKNRTTEEKQKLLDALQEQVEDAAFNKFGAEAYQRYKAGTGRWINSLGRL